MPTIHREEKLWTHGTPLAEARAAVILLHGRGGEASDILSLAPELPDEGFAYLAPQATGRTWYPNSGFAAFETNEPHLGAALRTVADLLAAVRDAGIPAESTAIGGFSQGACLGAEFVARHARRYGGLFVLSGALLGPPDTPRHYQGSLEGTPVFVGGCDGDPWVGGDQLRMTAEVLRRLGADVRLEIQHEAEHTIRRSELARVREMLELLPSS